jgi:rhodanese-related sulfurtransferase
MHPLAFIRAAVGVSFALAFVRAENVSLGVVYQGEETVFELPCANGGKQAIWVTEAVSSCDCLKARFAPKPVEPGKTVRLGFVYRSKVAGRFSVEVQLRGSEPAAVFGTHTITGFVADKAWLLPVAQLFGNSASVVTGPGEAGPAFAEASSFVKATEDRSAGRPGSARSTGSTSSHSTSSGSATPQASSGQATPATSSVPSGIKPTLRVGLLGSSLAQKAVIIDTRSAERFARMHIPRSLNLPAFAVKSRADLRERPLVLVDEGFAPGLLLEEAASLRRLGFSQVVVLDGGLAAWIRQGRAVEGTESTPLAVTSLSVSDFMRTRRSVEWRALEMKSQTSGVRPLEFAVEVDCSEEIARVLPVLGQAVAGRQAPRILVIAPDQATCARIEARMGATNPAPIYYLTGGRAALDVYRREQKALVQQPHQLIQIRPNRGRPVAAGGCSTCPKSGGH